MKKSAFVDCFFRELEEVRKRYEGDAKSKIHRLDQQKHALEVELEKTKAVLEREGKMREDYEKKAHDLQQKLFDGSLQNNFETSSNFENRMI